MEENPLRELELFPKRIFFHALAEKRLGNSSGTHMRRGGAGAPQPETRIPSSERCVRISLRDGALRGRPKEFPRRFSFHGLP